MPTQMDWLAECAFDRSAVAHPPRARRRDPATSHEAAARTAAFAGDHETRILKVITDAGSLGATAKEVASKTGLTDVQVNRRLGAMGERGLIVRRLRDSATEAGDYERREGCAAWWKT